MGSRQIFSRSGVVVLGLAAASARAQMHHVEAPQKVTRAVGVYEWTGELTKPTAARFVPVSLFINGHFEDAGLYLARPVPFALETGNLYTVERAGEPEGALSLEQAQRVVTGNALADDNSVGAWYGYGKFTGQAAPQAAPALHRSAHVGVIQSTSGNGGAATAHGTGSASGGDAEDDGRPHMRRRGASDSTGTSTDSGAGGGTDSTASTSSGGDDTDRPSLRRRDPSQDATRQKASVGGRKADEASVRGMGPQPGEDPDRPSLTRKTAADEGPKELTGIPAGLQQAVAVSDAADRDPHPFARPWEGAAERKETMAAVNALVRPRVLAYLSENKLVPSTAIAVTASTVPAAQSKEGTAAATENGSGAPPKLQRGRPTEYSAATGSAPAKPVANAATGHGRTASRTPAQRAGTKIAQSPLLFQEEQISGYTLSYGGLPTFVYSANVPAAVAQPGDLPPAAARPTVFVTVVAQRLPSGELQVALSSLTDSTHLDRSPKLRLVDVVDPDDSHRASLLFEMRGSSSRQFALYRLTSARAENTFTSASIE